MPVDVGRGDLRVGQDAGEFGQRVRGVGAHSGLAEVEEHAVLQRDRRPARLHRLERSDRREGADAPHGGHRVRLDALPVDQCRSVAVVHDAQTGLVAVRAAAVAVVHDGDAGLRIGVVARAPGVDGDIVAGLRVHVESRSVAVGDDLQCRGVVVPAAAGVHDDLLVGVAVGVVSRAVAVVDQRDRPVCDGAGSVAVVGDALVPVPGVPGSVAVEDRVAPIGRQRAPVAGGGGHGDPGHRGDGGRGVDDGLVGVLREHPDRGQCEQGDGRDLARLVPRYGRRRGGGAGGRRGRGAGLGRALGLGGGIARGATGGECGRGGEGHEGRTAEGHEGYLNLWSSEGGVGSG